jgi:hypothetical protein
LFYGNIGAHPHESGTKHSKKSHGETIRCFANADFEVDADGEITGFKPGKTLIDGVCGAPISLPLDPSTNKVLIPENAAAAAAHQVPTLRDTYGVSGKGVSIGLWDGGIAQVNHQEFGTRLSYGEYKYLNDHATHVAGTLAASGQDSEAKGMAPGAVIISFDFDKDLNEMSLYNKFQVSNHSYGVPAGWNLIKSSLCKTHWFWGGNDSEIEDYHFGKYDYSANAMDKHIFYNQMMSVFIAAGNEGSAVVDPLTHVPNRQDPKEIFNGHYCIYKNGKITSSNKIRNSDLAKGRYDTLTGHGLSKNAIVVGAAEDLEPNFKDWMIRVTNFSSVGGGDDGRIKPDVVANGRLLYSARIPARCNLKEGGSQCPPNEAKIHERKRYGAKNGTSMATPVVTGIGALLNEVSLKRSKLKRYLFADEMRSLLTHTSRSPTSDGAPTYFYGWGLVDAIEAADLLSAKTKSSSVFERLQLKSGVGREEKTITWDDPSKALRVSFTWIDEPTNQPIYDTLNDPKPVLVRDVDIRLISPSGMIYYPWTLSMTPDPSAKAVSCSHHSNAGTTCPKNLVDNLERIDLPSSNYETGQWTVVFDTSKVKMKPWHGNIMSGVFAKSEVKYSR